MTYAPLLRRSTSVSGVSSAAARRAVPGVETVRRSLDSPFSIEEGTLLEEEAPAIQAKATGDASSAAAPAPSSVAATLRRPGVALPVTERTFMERRLGHSFRDVRIHSDAAAAEAAASVGARAFTLGPSIVFAQGQYSPESESGRWLLAHELTHVVQQGAATLDERDSPRDPSAATGQREGQNVLRRVKWGTARDTGRDSMPWGQGPNGDVHTVQTDAGTQIFAWKPHDGQTYWCHGYTFGGATAAGGPFSIWGQHVPTVIKDDGWQPAPSCVAEKGDILVFTRGNVAHSGIVRSRSGSGVVDEQGSTLDSKWGQAALNASSWLTNATQYGPYDVFSKAPVFGPCLGKGANER